MSDKLRFLITGFGPFPGAPFNPTQPLVKRLTQLRRPALGDVELVSHIFHVTYATVDRELPELIARYRPSALLMFVADGAGAMMFGPHTAKLLRAAVATGIDARASRDAGSYLCNYLSWRAIEAVGSDNGLRLAAFVHVPLLRRDGAFQRKNAAHRVTLEQLVDAGEAMLLEMARLTRQAARTS